MLGSDVTLDEVAYSSVSQLCEDFLERSNATCALLVGQDGLLLQQCGTVTGLDIDALSALAAGTFASSREMARLIGEASFDIAIQQGLRNHLQLIRVGEWALLVVVFDNSTTAALVRVHGRRMVRRLAHVAREETALAVRSLIGVTAEGVAPPAGPEEKGPEFIAQAEAKTDQLRAALRLRTLAFALALLAAAVALSALWHH